MAAWRPNAQSAASSRKGRRRRINEDRVFCDPSAGIYGVCDGHGADSSNAPSSPSVQSFPSQKVAELLPKLLVKGYTYEEAFLEADRQICAMHAARSYIGTTVTVARVVRGECMRVAHVGDSRAMLIDKRGAPQTLTTDHNPDREDETARIENEGGHVLRGRVNGVLAVSRAIGDCALKPVVPATPDVAEYALAGDDQLLVVASDGLWDVMSDVEVVNMVKGMALASGSVAVPRDLQRAADDVVEEAIARGCRDDISVVMVDIRASV